MSQVNYQVDVCVVGAGAGGLSVAYVAAKLGLNVVLLESGKMGGDCLNSGCVPSKSLLSAAKKRYGMGSGGVDYAQVQDYVQGVIDSIAPHDSAERYREMGVTVIQQAGHFLDERTVVAGDQVIRARYIVVATGSRAAVPPIPGLDQVNYYANETIFSLRRQPKRLIVIGGGPIGSELAQAHAMLGTPVILLELFSILPKDDVELVDIVRQSMVSTGVDIREGVEIISVAQRQGDVVVKIKHDGVEQEVVGSDLLVAAGRLPNIEGLDLDKARVSYDKRGIRVNKRLRTSNRRVFAVGDVAGGFQFTHVAGYHAGVVVRNAFFRVPSRVDYRALPWVTYTYPELAHVGLNESMAKAEGIDYRVLEVDMAGIDRARAEGDLQGKIKVLASPRGDVLGATIVGGSAGDLIMPWVMAIQSRLKLKVLASMIVPYPTRSDITKQVAGQFYAPLLGAKKTRWLLRVMRFFWPRV